MLYVLLTFIVAGISLALAGIAWQRRAVPGVKALAGMMLLAAWWQVAVGLQVLSPTPAAAVAWFNALFFSVAISPVIFLIFVWQYTAGEAWLNPGYLAPLFIIPLLTQILIWTNQHHKLVMSEFIVEPAGGLMLVQDWIPGPWFFVHAIYSYVLIVLALIWLGYRIVRSFSLYRRQMVALAVGIGLLVVFNLADTLKLLPSQYTVTPFGFTILGIFLLWSIFRHKLFDVVPVARNKLIDMMADGMVVLDTQGRVVDLNPAAETILGIEANEAIGRSGRAVLGRWPELLEQLQEVSRTAEMEISLTRPHSQTYYDLRTSPVLDRQGKPTGYLLLFRNISARKRQEAEQQKLIEELQTALAQVKKLSRLLPICASCKKIRDDAGYWHQVEVYMSQHTEVEFSHGLCPDCAKKLYPDFYKDE